MSSIRSFNIAWRLGLLAVAALAVILCLVLDGSPSVPAGRRRAMAEPVADPPAGVPLPGSIRPAAVAPDRASPIAACPRSSLDWRIKGMASKPCLAVRVSVSDSGNLRSYRIESTEGDARWLRIDTAAGRVVAAAAGDGQNREYACRAEACSGVTIGERDLQDVRRIAIARLLLHAGTDDVSALQVSGRFEFADDAGDEAACAGQQVAVSRGDGGLTNFCPDDGTGSSVDDDGSRHYRFADREGRGIIVHLDARGGLLGIASGDAACVGAECVGASVSATGTDGARALQLHGTLLTQPAGWVQLDGSLLLPG